MSKKNQQHQKNKNIGRRFIIFVKPVDKDGFTIESKCGWISTKNEVDLVFSMKDAMVFTEKEEGHGSYNDWKKFFEEEYKDWRINPPVYLDELHYV